jgi:lipopolysaccharide export system protein LptA
MAEISINRYKHYLLIARQISIYVLALFYFPYIGFSQQPQNNKQNKRIIEIMHFDSIGQNGSMSSDFKRLLGHVSLKQNDILMFCDSAHHYSATKQVMAFSKVHIKQGDTLDLYGNYLFYDGIEGKAFMEGKVELIDKKTHLFTKALNYDINTKVASYKDSGKIINEKNTLTSLIGIYYTSQKMFHFKDSVRIVNPEYVMTADTMEYSTESETAFFTGPTRIKGDSIFMYSEKGWYDTKKDVSHIWKNAYINNKKQIIRGDSLFFNNKLGFGQAFRNISIADTTNSLLVVGNYGWYYKNPEKFMVTDRAVFIQASDKDSLFLHADTISSVTKFNKTGVPYRLMRAYFNCKIFSGSLQAKCDSLSYSLQDSVIRLYHAPVLWSESNQMKSDSIAIFTRNRKAEVMELYNSAFIVSLVDSIRFNQIKGRNMKAFFKENKLFRIRIDGNGETIYFLSDKNGQIGWNRAKCSSIEIYVNDGKITEINEFENPDGVLNPPLIEVDKQKLPGFIWLDNLRPKIKADIFKK